jgi:hypothetical protein
VRVWEDGVEALERTFIAPRSTDVDLLAEAIEAGGRDPVAEGASTMAAALVGLASHGAASDVTSSADGVHVAGKP